MEELAALAARNDAARAAAKSREDASSQEDNSGDASADSEWTQDSDDDRSSGAEILASCDEHDSDVSDEDTRVILISDDLRETVTSLIHEDPCERKCLEGKASELEQFMCSLSQMTTEERKQSIMTTLALLMQIDTITRHRGYGVRQQFNYHLSMVGHVCREAWCSCYGLSPPTLTRYRNRIKGGAFSVKAHGNRLNQNASAVDLRWLVSWFQEFSATVGDVVPVRVRKQKTVDGTVKLQYSDTEYTMLPAYFTWAQIYREMHNYVDEIALRVREPRPSTFRQYLKKLCPTIRIRSPRSNICDVCSIYWGRMRSGATAAETESFGEHTVAARRMREEYKSDLAAANDENAVLIIDYSQNLTVPSVSSTPSQWYFLSLRSVHLFGIYFANKQIQYNYVYDETVAGKGSDEVNSMLHHFVRRVVIPGGYWKVTIYADNCGGQNKNSYVVRMLLGLTHIEEINAIDLKFFVKGHTKNAVDRGFGHVRKHLARVDIWTLDQLIGAVDDASSSSALVHVPNDNSIFKAYRDVVSDAYKPVKHIQKFQIFSMTNESPGVVACRKGPDGEEVRQDLRRKYDGIVTDATLVRVLFGTDLKEMPNPPPNHEKNHTIYRKVRPYVPEEFRTDPLYNQPNAETELGAKDAKKARADRSKAACAARKRKQELRPQPKAAATSTSPANDVSSEAAELGQPDEAETPPDNVDAAEEKPVAPKKKRARKATP